MGTAKANAKDILSNYISYFIKLKRSHQFQHHIYTKNSSKTIKNDVLLNHFRLAFDGLIACFHNYNSEFLDSLRNRMASSHAKEFGFKRLMKLAKSHGNQDSMHFGYVPTKAEILAIKAAKAEQYRKEAAKVYEVVFPGLIGRSDDVPTKDDFNSLADRYEAMVKPIKNHRDTCTAHWDKKRMAIDPDVFADTFKDTEEFLKHLYFVTAYASYSFTLGGLASSVSQTGDRYSKILLGQK